MDIMHYSCPAVIPVQGACSSYLVCIFGEIEFVLNY